MATYDLATQEFLKVLTSVLGPVKSSALALHEPNIGEHEHQLVAQCLSSGWVSSVGAFITQFENQLSKITGAAHVVATVSGTTGLHLSLYAVGVKPGNEVIVPTLSFVATANSVAHCGAIPHFADSSSETLGMDPIALRKHLASTTTKRGGDLINTKTGNRIGAIVPMHAFGHPMQIDELDLVATEFDLPIVEDAAESLGSYYNEKHTGTFGLLGTLSFNGNKTITTGGGGAILTNNSDLARHAKHLTTTAKLPHAWEFLHDEIGYNYRMPNINAALGCAQLEQLPDKLESKRNLFKKYQHAFANVQGVRLLSEPKNCHSNYWLQTLLLDESRTANRDLVLEATNNAGLMTRPAWVLINKLEPFNDSPSADLSTAQSLSRRIINIPSSPGLI